MTEPKTIRFDRITEPFVAGPPVPTCAVCRKPVDSVVYFDNLQRGRCGVRIIYAICHGEVHGTMLDLHEVAAIEASGGKVSLTGVAFGSESDLRLEMPATWTGGDSCEIGISSK